MNRLIACLLVVITIVTAVPGVAASPAVDCLDVDTYFGRLDDVIGERMTELIDQPGFMENLAKAAERTGADNSGFLSLAAKEKEAILLLMSVPGDALLTIDGEDIPNAVSELHASATDRWVTMPEMMRAIADDGPSAGMAYVDHLETTTDDNLRAGETLRESCPGEVAAYAGESGEMDASPGGFGDDPAILRELVSTGTFDGIGYPVLFFPAGEDGPSATPTPQASGSHHITS